MMPEIKSCRVLLVEDDAGDANLIRQLLRSSSPPRFEVDAVVSLAGARQLLQNTQPEALLLDLSLPDSSGLATVLTARQMADGIPIIVLTGHDDAEFALQVLEAGAQDYLVKGNFDADHLVRTIRHALSRSRLEQRLIESEERFHNMADSAPLLIWISDPDRQFTWFNRTWLDFTGRRLEQELGDGWMQGVHPEDFLQLVSDYQQQFDSRLSFEVEFRLRGADGEYRILRSYGRPCFDGSSFSGYIGMCVDVTERKRVEIELREQKDFLKAVFENEPECVKIVTPDGSLLDMNPAGLAMLGVDSVEDVRHVGLLEFIDEEYREAFVALHKRVCAGQSGKLEFPIHSKKGTVRWVETHATPLFNPDGAVRALLGVTRDITERRILQQELQNQAHMDYLTGLANRRYFMEQAEAELSRAVRYGNALSLLMLDIDFFKKVNDTYGHKTGDMVLQKLSQVCRDELREIDIPARIGGEEFAILLPETDGARAVEVAERLRLTIADLSIPLESGLPLQFTVSIGVATLTGDKVNIDMLLHLADQALYKAKNGGRNKVVAA